MIEPPCTERYAWWCERAATQLMGSLLLDVSPNTVAGGNPIFTHAEAIGKA